MCLAIAKNDKQAKWLRLRTDRGVRHGGKTRGGLRQDVRWTALWFTCVVPWTRRKHRCPSSFLDFGRILTSTTIPWSRTDAN